MPRAMASSTKESIVRAALELFSQNSYARVSIDDVASRAGVSKGAIFHYFSSKIALAEEALKQLLGEVESSVDSVVSAPIDCREKLERLVDLALKWAVMGRENKRALLFLTEIYRELVKMGRGLFVKEMYVRMRKKISRLLKDTGVGNPDTRARIFLVLLDGLALWYIFFPEIFTEEFIYDLKREIVGVILCK